MVDVLTHPVSLKFHQLVNHSIIFVHQKFRVMSVVIAQDTWGMMATIIVALFVVWFMRVVHIGLVLTTINNFLRDLRSFLVHS